MYRNARQQVRHHHEIERTADSIACPISGSKPQVDVCAAHAYGRAPDNLILKVGRSGRVMDASAARQARVSDGDFRDSYVWSLASNSSSIGYYPLHVARLTNCEAES